MATFASATFTGTAGTDLVVADSNWTEHPNNNLGQMVITDANRGRTTDGNYTCYYHNGAPANANYEVSADLYCASNASSHYDAICARLATSAITFYGAYVVGASGYQLYKVVAGTATQLGSTVARTFVAGTSYPVKIKVDGNQISVYKDNETTPIIGPITDTAITAAGKSGLRFLGVATNTTSFHIDNFTAADLGGGGTPWSVTHDTKAAITTSQTINHDLQASVFTSLATTVDILATISTAVAALSDTHAVVSTALTSTHDTRAVIASAITTLHDTLADISALVGYVVTHDLRAIISTQTASLHDLRATVATSVAISADTMAAIATAMTSRSDIQAEVSTQLTSSADMLAAISSRITMSHDTSAIITLLGEALEIVRFAATVSDVDLFTVRLDSLFDVTIDLN